MSNYTFAKLNCENLKHLYTLFEAVYHKSAPKQYFDQKYNTSYTGAEYIGFLAFQNELPVAYYGVIPTLVSLNQQTILAAQSCDTMTHPAHQKKGLFITLAKQTFELAKSKGIHFVFGFPNQNSYPGFIQKLDFTHSETLNRYTIKYQNTPFKLLYRKLGLINYKEKAETISNPFLDEGYDGIIYSKEYIQYKKNYNKSLIIQKKNISFWINQSNGAWIGLPSPFTDGSFSQTIKTLENITNASSITFMMSTQNRFAEEISKVISPEKGFAVITKNLSGKYNLNNLKFQFSDIDIF